MTALLVGEIGSGKTTVCQRVVELARKHGLRPAGILSRPTRDRSGRKRSLVAVDLWTGRSRLLASLDRRLSDLCRGPYSFDPATFDWANQAVLVALQGAPDLILLDEIGPLELVAGAGFASLLAAVVRGPCPSLLVVRRECRRALEARLPARPLVFEVDRAGRDALPARIVNALCCPAKSGPATSHRRSASSRSRFPGRGAVGGAGRSPGERAARGR